MSDPGPGGSRSWLDRIGQALSGEPQDTCPYKSDVIAAAWEAGWNDGRSQALPHHDHEQDMAIA